MPTIFTSSDPEWHPPWLPNQMPENQCDRHHLQGRRAGKRHLPPNGSSLVLAPGTALIFSPQLRNVTLFHTKFLSFFQAVSEPSRIEIHRSINQEPPKGVLVVRRSAVSHFYPFYVCDPGLSPFPMHVIGRIARIP